MLNPGDACFVVTLSGRKAPAVFVEYADAETRRFCWVSFEAGTKDPFASASVVPQ